MRTLKVTLAKSDTRAPMEKDFRMVLKGDLQNVGINRHRSRFFKFHHHTIRSIGASNDDKNNKNIIYEAEFEGSDREVEQLVSAAPRVRPGRREEAA